MCARWLKWRRANEGKTAYDTGRDGGTICRDDRPIDVSEVCMHGFSNVQNAAGARGDVPVQVLSALRAQNADSAAAGANDSKRGDGGG